MEEWKDIPGYENLYQASTEGRIKSLPKLHNTKYPYTQPEQILKGSLHKKGYLWVHLSNNKKEKIHSLILRTFVGPCPEGMEGTHDNGIKIDNRLSNLLYKTHYDNIVTDERRLKDKTTSAKLTDTQVVEIKRCILNGEKDRQLAKFYGVHIETIGYIRRNKSHAHVPWPTLI